MKAGTQKISTTSLLGYDTDDDGEMVIVTNEAEIVRTIYMSFDKGMHPAEIAEKLNALEIRTIKNNPWTGESVKNILRNEKYCGDAGTDCRQAEAHSPQTAKADSITKGSAVRIRPHQTYMEGCFPQEIGNGNRKGDGTG